MLAERPFERWFGADSDTLTTVKTLHPVKPCRTGRGRSGRRSREGSTAVEFALIATPFFFMLFAIFEIALLFVTNLVLENAVLQTGRLIRTGEASNSNMSSAEFKTALCAKMAIFSGDCPSRATVDVRVISTFRNVTPTDPLADGKTFDASKLTYATGAPGNLMLVRVWYRQPLITPFLTQALSTLNSGATILTATTTFINEPYK